eukprot:gene32607-41931_t
MDPLDAVLHYADSHLAALEDVGDSRAYFMLLAGAVADPTPQREAFAESHERVRRRGGGRAARRGAGRPRARPARAGAGHRRGSAPPPAAARPAGRRGAAAEAEGALRSTSPSAFGESFAATLEQLQSFAAMDKITLYVHLFALRDSLMSAYDEADGAAPPPPPLAGPIATNGFERQQQWLQLIDLVQYPRHDAASLGLTLLTLKLFASHCHPANEPTATTATATATTTTATATSPVALPALPVTEELLVCLTDVLQQHLQLSIVEAATAADSWLAAAPDASMFATSDGRSRSQPPSAALTTTAAASAATKSAAHSVHGG